MTRNMQKSLQTIPAIQPEGAITDSEHSSHCPSANVLGIPVDALNMESALTRVLDILRSQSKGYICAIGVHGILESRRDVAVARAIRGATMRVPDGMPLVWIGHLQGHRDMHHVTGPHLMNEIFRQERFADYSHFFYGGKPGVAKHLAETMQTKFPWLRIAGTYTPPFRDLTSSERDAAIEMINRSKADMIWVGISTPRQDIFMHNMLPNLHTRLMFGVGAAFDFHTGNIKECPEWIKTAGFHWLHRLLQDPKRLWRRNLGNTSFLWYIALQLTGFRRYRPMQH